MASRSSAHSITSSVMRFLPRSGDQPLARRVPRISPRTLPPITASKRADGHRLGEGRRREDDQAEESARRHTPSAHQQLAARSRALELLEVRALTIKQRLCLALGIVRDLAGFTIDSKQDLRLRCGGSRRARRDRVIEGLQSAEVANSSRPAKAFDYEIDLCAAATQEFDSGLRAGDRLRVLRLGDLELRVEELPPTCASTRRSPLPLETLAFRRSEVGHAHRLRVHDPCDWTRRSRSLAFMLRAPESTRAAFALSRALDKEMRIADAHVSRPTDRRRRGYAATTSPAQPRHHQHR